MTKRSAAARAKARSAQRRTAARPAPRPAHDARTPAPRRPLSPREVAPAEALVLYREAAGYDLWMRLSLAAGLALLTVSTIARDAGAEPPPPIAGAGLGGVFAFLLVTAVRHYRALFRLRRGGVWSNTGRFMLMMAAAPFGALDPEATRRDRLLVRVIIALAVALLVSSVAGGVTRR